MQRHIFLFIEFKKYQSYFSNEGIVFLKKTIQLLDMGPRSEKDKRHRKRVGVTQIPTSPFPN